MSSRKSLVGWKSTVSMYCLIQTLGRLLDAEDLGLVVSTKDYYNTVLQEESHKSKSRTIVAS